ncbi:MAG: transcriptional regulator MraZ [Neisseriaceae bacterium]|nr:MAG: transcriptional regulator MraZ [Neisseriaceae bacterium]
MLGGVTHLNLDPKNRLAIPAKYRDILQAQDNGKVVITLESAQCLLIYPEAEWEQVRAKVQNLPNSVHPLVKSYQRLVLGHAESIELDKAGRVLLPATLKNMAGLDRELVLVGMGNRFELWDKTKWTLETEKALQASAEDLASLLNGFSI